MGVVRHSGRKKLTRSVHVLVFIANSGHHQSQILFFQQRAAQDLSEVVASATNRTLENSWLVYNRVPKCSSTAMLLLLMRLSRVNDFNVTNIEQVDIPNALRQAGKEQELMRTIASLPRGSVYVRHVWNPNWQKHNMTVNLVNMVRDPIERMASFFHFIR